MTTNRSTVPLTLDANVPAGLSLALWRLRAVAQAARFYQAALPNVKADVKWARLRLAEGIPALTGEVFLDWRTFDSIVRALIGLYEEVPDDSASSAVRRDVDCLVSELGEDELRAAAFAGAWDDLADVGTPEGHDVRQAAITLLDYATRPALHSAAASLRDVISEFAWTRGTCPACGALPLLAELHANKDGQSRVLRCARCATAWAFNRLVCPACGERDHSTVRYLHVAGEVDHRRAECCTACGFYLKAVAALDPLSVEQLFDVDLETIGLDTLAIEAGYSRRRSDS